MANLRHGGFFDMAEWIVRINRRMNDLDRIEIPAFCGARYTTDAGQSISDSTVTIIDFEDQDYDTHSAVTTGAAWKFTAPVNGYYLVSACILFTTTTTWAETERIDIRLYKGGVFTSNLAWIVGLDSSGATQYKGANGADTIYLAAAEYIDIRVSQNSGGALALHNVASYNYVAIERVG